jgi:hypothetical protein
LRVVVGIAVHFTPRATHDGGVTVGGQRNGGTLPTISNRASAHQLWPLLRELRQRRLR